MGAHSPWVSRLLTECDHEVFVANPRNVRLTYEDDRKTDRVDAEWLARIAQLDPKLLAPIQHRGPGAQADLALIRSRDAMMVLHARLINHVRGTVKEAGGRVPKCSTWAFEKKGTPAIPEALLSPWVLSWR